MLAQSVLSAMPAFAMQTNLLPKGITNAIEQIIRRFIWSGSNDKQGGVHLVKWNDFIKPKKEGGLGLRNLRDMNLAFMAKLG